MKFDQANVISKPLAYVCTSAGHSCNKAKTILMDVSVDDLSYELGETEPWHRARNKVDQD